MSVNAVLTNRVNRIQEVQIMHMFDADAREEKSSSEPGFPPET